MCARTLSHVAVTDAAKVGKMSKPNTLIEVTASTQGRGQLRRMAQEPWLRIIDFLLWLRIAPAAASNAKVILCAM